MTPCATRSHWVTLHHESSCQSSTILRVTKTVTYPPKILMNIDLTSGSCASVKTDSLAFFALAPPPPSRKFAGCTISACPQLSCSTSQAVRKEQHLAAAMDDSIHSAHCQSSTISESSDITESFDIKETFLFCSEFIWMFILLLAVFCEFRMDRRCKGI